MSGIIALIAEPFRRIGDALELRRLRRQFPNARRRLITIPQGVRTETNDEFLDRLRLISIERNGY